MPPHSEQIVSRICGALFRGSLERAAGASDVPAAGRDWRLRVDVRRCARVARSPTARAAFRFAGRSLIYTDRRHRSPRSWADLAPHRSGTATARRRPAVFILPLRQGAPKGRMRVRAKPCALSMPLQNAMLGPHQRWLSRGRG
ncbi:hypothetical protein EBA01_08125 [Xanthomonas oryzae pv. oryzae]|nr:hypothetical protein C0L89_08125 [Xanthomonas oryzae pv. oryzae]AVU02392.1 hypothetical protein C0L90_07910 [Xanthomonas oryzae pv. oryzae]QBI12038.1 hypothetical protein EYR02_08215 [Xanthomonas oryzae pv. oryzae]QBI15593.1 hypothetical protein EYR03_07960 [Xanthomonas oryzae pv. oryzae]QBN25432.1 hypothetical protein EBA00_14325 [Xanthomonas oryzae pv. oryzae]